MASLVVHLQPHIFKTMQMVCTFLRPQYRTLALDDAYHHIDPRTALGIGVHCPPTERMRDHPASEATIRLQCKVTFSRVVVRPLMHAVAMSIGSAGLWPVNTRQMPMQERIAVRTIKQWLCIRVRELMHERRVPVCKLSALAEQLLRYVGLFLGNLTHLLVGNGGYGKGGRGKGQSEQGTSRGDYTPGGHNPAWQSWMPRAYQEQKSELERYRKQEEYSKQAKAISGQIRAGLGQLMDGLMGSRRAGKERRAASASPGASTSRKRSRGRHRDRSRSSADGAERTFFSKLGKLKRALTRRRTDTTAATSPSSARGRSSSSASSCTQYRKNKKKKTGKYATKTKTTKDKDHKHRKSGEGAKHKKGAPTKAAATKKGKDRRGRDHRSSSSSTPRRDSGARASGDAGGSQAHAAQMMAEQQAQISRLQA
eukprot:12464912-Alexandrium_andersonii.AAC.1